MSGSDILMVLLKVIRLVILMTDEENESRRQDAPWSWRPYKPVRDALKHYAPDNLNFMINLALAEKLGIHEQIIEAYRRKKSDND